MTTSTIRPLQEIITTYGLTELEANWNEIEGLRVSYLTSDERLETTDQQDELEDELNEAVEACLTNHSDLYNGALDGTLDAFSAYCTMTNGVLSVSGHRTLTITEEF